MFCFIFYVLYIWNTNALNTTSHHVVPGKDAVFAKELAKLVTCSAEIVYDLAETTEGWDAQLAVKTSALQHVACVRGQHNSMANQSSERLSP